jgi:putative membrane protein
MNKFVSIASAAALALTLAACGPKTEKAADDAASTTGNALEAAGSATSNAAQDVKEALTPTPSGQEFIDKAARSDAFEIAAAKLAITNAATAKVKSFASEMTKAHTASTAKIKAAAKEASPSLTPDPTLTSDQSDKLADLGKLTGADFDKQYASGQVSAHKAALTLMDDYAKNGDVATLKAAAHEIAPTVRKHLDMAEKLDK